MPLNVITTSNNPARTEILLWSALINISTINMQATIDFRSAGASSVTRGGHPESFSSAKPFVVGGRTPLGPSQIRVCFLGFIWNSGRAPRWLINFHFSISLYYALKSNNVASGGAPVPGDMERRQFEVFSRQSAPQPLDVQRGPFQMLCVRKGVGGVGSSGWCRL
jgi:hypothetical protein